MLHEVIPQPRRLVRMWVYVRDGLPSAGRYKRYFTSMAPPIVAVWGATLLYLALAPPTYTSNLTLILPGSGAGGSINVESIGQAQSSAASAFSSTTLSPTENYKRLLMADVTLRSASRTVHEAEGSFPDPAIKLTDQTNLIEIEVEGGSASQAHDRAQALLTGFLVQLDRLRTDEALKREAADSDHLKALEAKVREAQSRLLQFQASNGLVSIEQFNTRVAGIDALREREREMRTTFRQQRASSSRYSGILRAGSDAANYTLRLKSDPLFQKLAERYAVLASDAEQKAATLGDAHADRAQAEGERNALKGALMERGKALTGLAASRLMEAVDIAVSDGRSHLFEGLIETNVQTAGTGAALAEMRSDLARQQRGAAALVAKASVLADLTRDHRVAEAVFSSALARLDTNKQDSFASYPLVQVLEQPSLPKKPSSPSKVLALGGAVLATLMILIGFGLLWLRQPLIHKFFPSV